MIAESETESRQELPQQICKENTMTWTQTQKLYQHFTPDRKISRSPGFSRVVGNRRAVVYPIGLGWSFEAFVGKHSVLADHQTDDFQTREQATQYADAFLDGGEYFEF